MLSLDVAVDISFLLVVGVAATTRARRENHRRFALDEPLGVCEITQRQSPGTAQAVRGLWRFRGSSPSGERLEHRVDPREAALRTLLDAVLHGRVAFLGRGEAHGLGQLRPLVAEILELERLQVVLERLDEPLRRLDLAEL